MTLVTHTYGDLLAQTIRAPRISVLLPVYNAESFLRDAIDSVLSQTFSDFELLMLDDGSTDNSAAILREYEAKDPRVRVFFRRNRGLAFTLNELIGMARGELLARMDDDDICLPSRFEKQIAFLDAHPDHVLVGGWIEQMNEAGQPIGTIRSPTAHEGIDEANSKGHCSVWHPTAMMRKSSVLAIAGYDVNLENAEDIDLWLRLAEVGKLANLETAVLKYRLHGASMSAKNRDKQLANTRLACVHAWARRGVNGHFDAVNYWRPGSDTASRHKFALRYGWVAWNNNYRETWWRYACEAMRLRPFAPSSWNLLVFGLCKRPRLST